MKKNSNSQTKSGQKTKPVKARGPVQRESKQVMAELVAKLSERLEQNPAQENATKEKPQGTYACGPQKQLRFENQHNTGNTQRC